MTTCCEWEQLTRAEGYSRLVATTGTCATCRFRSHAEIPEWAGWHLCYHPVMGEEIGMILKTYACGAWGSREPGSGQIIGAKFRPDVY